MAKKPIFVSANEQAVATHALVFMIRGLRHQLKTTVANFATTTASADQLYFLFWDAVCFLELSCNIRVIYLLYPLPLNEHFSSLVRFSIYS